MGPAGAPGAPGKDGADGVVFDGSRLKARWLVGADGSKSLVAGEWLDTVTSQRCAYSTATDGALRCLPDAFSPADGVNAAIFYSDSACTSPLAVLYEDNNYDGGVPAFDSSWFILNSSSETYVHILAPASPPGVFFKHPACGPFAITTPTFFWTVDVLPPSFFVSASVQ